MALGAFITRKTDILIERIVKQGQYEVLNKQAHGMTRARFHIKEIKCPQWMLS